MIDVYTTFETIETTAVCTSQLRPRTIKKNSATSYMVYLPHTYMKK